MYSICHIDTLGIIFRIWTFLYIFLEKFIVYTGMWVGSLVLNLKSLVRSLPVTLYTFYTILNMLSEWFKPTQSGSMVLSGHGKWLCPYIPRQLGSRTLVAGLWSGRVRAGLVRNMDIFSNPTKVHGRALWANPFTISHFSHKSHWYWDVGLWSGRVRGRTRSEYGYLLKPNKNTRSCTLG